MKAVNPYLTAKEFENNRIRRPSELLKNNNIYWDKPITWDGLLLLRLTFV